MLLKIIIMLMLCCGVATACEVLVQATDSSYEAGAKRGDIIVVRPDGWVWGKEECPPRYYVVKYPGIKAEDCKYMEEPLTKEVSTVVDGKVELTTEVVALRKHQVPKTTVDTASIASKGVLTVSTALKDIQLTEKVVDVKVVK